MASLKLYLSKLSKEEDSFFQLPRKPQTESFDNMSVWYKRKLGHNTLDTMMKRISQLAGLSQIFTNHSIRATTCTVLAHNNIAPSDIIHVTGHKHPNSLIPYIGSSSNQKRREMGEILHSYGKSAASATMSSVQNTTTSNLSVVSQGAVSLLEQAKITGSNVTINICQK